MEVLAYQLVVLSLCAGVFGQLRRWMRAASAYDAPDLED
jgi:hypothetical protein